MNKLRLYRLDAGLTQERLAEKLGLAKGAICNYEKGTRSPSLQLSYRIVAALNNSGVDCLITDVFPDKVKTKAA